MMRSTAPLSSTCINLRHVEEVLYDLPPLEGVFLHWHTYGMKATTSGIDSLLARRKQLLGSTTLPGTSIQLLYECATDCLRNLPIQDPHSSWDSRPLHARLLRHGSSMSADSTQALLPPGVLVQKTVSITLADTLLLCTSLGPQLLTRRQLRGIATALALPTCTVRRCTINPATCNPVEMFAMEPGMISPFLQPARDTGLTALVILPWPKRWEAQEREVAISLSLWESLVLPLRCLRQLLRIYAKRAYPAVRVIELASEDSSDGQADKMNIQPCPEHLDVGSASSHQDTGRTGLAPEPGYHRAALNRLHDDEGE
ncbi:MAG: hypothetical protein ACJ8BW_40845 [Ktedonobacteraceae bacterium]